MEIQQHDGVVVEVAGEEEVSREGGRRQGLGCCSHAPPPSPLALYIVGGRAGNHT